MRRQLCAGLLLLPLVPLLCGCRQHTDSIAHPEAHESQISRTVTSAAPQTVTQTVTQTECTTTEPQPLTAEALAAMPAGTVLDAAALSAQMTDALFTAEPISDELFARINGVSYTENPYITPDDLRYLRVLHCTPDGRTQIGELIVNRQIADALLEIFRALYDAAYPIEQIRLVDEYGGDDNASMADNNSSCFNYRTVPNKETLSYHARGLAIDINPLYNPYLAYDPAAGAAEIMPENAAPYADRTQDFPMKITEDDLCCRLFLEHGFHWGGYWRISPDYQHFEMRIPPA